MNVTEQAFINITRQCRHNATHPDLPGVGGGRGGLPGQGTPSPVGSGPVSTLLFTGEGGGLKRLPSPVPTYVVGNNINLYISVFA